MNKIFIPIPLWNGINGNYKNDRIYYNGPRRGQRASVDKFIYHWMDGTLASTDATFKNPLSIHSAHFGIENETVHQYVDITGTSFNSGNGLANCESIAIEHSAAPGREATASTYETSAFIVYSTARDLGKSVRDFQHLPHNHFSKTQCPGTLDIAHIVSRALSYENPTFEVIPAVSERPLQSIWVTVTARPSLNVRTQPRSSGQRIQSKQLYPGDRVEISEIVKGENVNGNSTWLKTKRSGLYIWSGGTDLLQSLYLN